MNNKQAQTVKKIEKIKRELIELGPMRPGTLTEQFKDPKNKKGSFYQLSYTFQMKSKTEYVRPTLLAQMKIETQNFKRFKQLTQQWAELALQLSKEKVQEIKKSGSTHPWELITLKYQHEASI